MTDETSTWTDDPPSDNGFYWARPREASSREVVEVLGCPDAPYVLRAGKDFEESVEAFEWWPARLEEPDATAAVRRTSGS